MDKERKKEMVSSYKETAVQGAVLGIRNRENGKLFIAAGPNKKGIENRHRFELTTGGHKCEALQKDWNSFGAGAFEFEILDTIEPDRNSTGVSPADVAELLDLWLDKLQPFGDKGYNVKVS